MISVFGSTGFIGRRFCEMYPEDVVGMPRRAYFVDTAEVLYLISTTHNYHVYDNLHLDIDTNLTVLMDVLSNCSKEYRPVISFVSSWMVYGNVNDLPAKEDACCRPKGFYSITKKCAEDLLISFCKTYEIDYRIFRLANVYGKGDIFSRRKNALQFLVSKLQDNEPIDLYWGGKFTRDYIHVDDVCRAMRFCMINAPLNDIINIGSGNPYVFRDLIYYVKDRIDSKSYIQDVEPSKFHKIVQVRDMWLDTTKLSNLGFKPRISIEEGLDRLLKSLRTRQE